MFMEVDYQLRCRGFDLSELARLLDWPPSAISRLSRQRVKLDRRRRLQLVILFEQTYPCLQDRRWDKRAARRRWKSQLRKRYVGDREFVTCKVPPLASRGGIRFLRKIVKTRRAVARLPALRSVSGRMGFRRRRRLSGGGVWLSFAAGVEFRFRGAGEFRPVQPRLDRLWVEPAASLPAWIERADI
jgi:hypothetical protein